MVLDMGGGDDLRERLAFLDLGEDDREVLAALRPALDRHADSLVGAFYRHLLSFDETRKLVADPDVGDRLAAHQKRYLLSLAEPALDEAYRRERVQIGETHQRVGLAPGWYLGAYALYFRLLIPLVMETHRADPALAERTILALLKVLMLDAQLAIESYIETRERDLEKLNSDLAEMSRNLEEAYARQREELRATSDRARAAEELASIATIVAGLAHEVGTPMSVIQGHAELLEDSVSDERALWRLRTIRQQIERIAGIIQTLLNMARPHETERVPVNLREIVASSLVFLSEKFKHRGIEIDSDLEPSVVMRGDPQKLQQLFINLFLNAADAMPDGGRLTATVRVEPDERVEVRVADSGQGIPPDALSRIFEPFFTTKQAGHGSGLGLMVARNIVRDHEGTIAVHSEPGAGTEFRISFPLEADQSTSRDRGT